MGSLKVIKVIKDTYRKVSLLLFHVFVFKQKGGTGNFGSVVLYKFSSSSTDAIKQISTYWMQIGALWETAGLCRQCNHYHHVACECLFVLGKLKLGSCRYFVLLRLSSTLHEHHLEI